VKYALLIYSKPGSHEAMSESEYAAAWEEYMALRTAPNCLDGAQLQPPHTATTVRMEDGQMLTTDGPYADTKEFFGGYYVFEAEDLDAALEIAGRIPAVRIGGQIEVRPVQG
jgi:hypothetical protein